jgi:hypothetical protein
VETSFEKKKDIVGFNVKGDLDLREWGMFEFVVLRARVLTLIHLDKHTGLVVGVGLPRGAAREDGGTRGDGLIGFDGLVGHLAIEEVRHEFDNTKDTGGATDEDDFVDVGLIDLRISEDLLDGLEGAAEEVLAELLKSGTGERGVEVDISKRESISMEVCVAEERVRLACSQAGRR